MQVFRDELEKISAKYGCQELHTEGFTPEQIYYQIEDLCNSIIERSESAISGLYPKYEIPLRNNEKICTERNTEDSESGLSDQGRASSVDIGIEKDSSAEYMDTDRDEPLESSDSELSENEIYQMPAAEAIRLLESRTGDSSGHSSDSYESLSEDNDE
ncbi:hypothetical protein EHEL_010170 [Encephalitozoon hellem ATCC 50504]|uniref:Uncharacterized protein n=1 Tax=Encephalitozoon hellem TaxID=27973 RepID=A0A9Q9C1G7_ENCHE|nr:uncharacterized protein EHEL_010170 [Encephalitozoon hellem ATCC 50504]AFM97642.1 hypothetical protein EHEL_010170 [Encephalitozoon hellem ATCC 50504]UTX42331.1 hypothetical protein GPU96_01g00320 [Encephalitozoon hellem]|eukprot:XP_003886623.1 hypothetical protein EHEL_010170 [Encephalitozoon hellem ATCC 50504]